MDLSSRMYLFIYINVLIDQYLLCMQEAIENEYLKS